MTEHEETTDGELVIPDEVYRQLETVRQSGLANMFTGIHSALRQLECDEALQWLNENEEAYYEHALTGGFVPESEYHDDEPLPSEEVK
jgi:CRISPR/Cas system-associated protein Csm6